MKDLNKMTLSQIEKHIDKIKMKVNQKSKTGIFRIGGKYLIRTVTMIYTGVLRQVTNTELIITNASWIAETKRWADTCEKGIFKEVEPYPKDAEVIINRQALLDMFEVEWNLPREQK